MADQLDAIVMSKARKWLDGDYDEATKKQVKYLIDNDKKELTESFYKDLEFGTGGLRGIMGVGTNRMNIYTVGTATQGLANYLKKNFAGEAIRVAVAHDSRNNSRMFAERVADIFASNGFHVYLFDALRPTPELSFAIRQLKCHSGVVITASHNPKEYNGYKAYWTDGAQVTAPHDTNIIAEVEKITDNSQVKTGANASNIEILGEDFDQKVLAQVEVPVVKARRMTLVSRFMPLVKAAAVIALMFSLGNIMQHSVFDNDGGIVSPDTIGKQMSAPSVALSDNPSESHEKQLMDSLTRGNKRAEAEKR